MINNLHNYVIQYNIASSNRKIYFICKKSKKNVTILNILLKQGLILGFYKFFKNPYELCVFLKYTDKNPIIKKLKVISSTGNRKFITKNKLIGDYETMSLYIISTNMGGMFLSTLKNSVNYNSFLLNGGEVLLKVYL
jgi:ribosomal protein S8